MAGNSKSPRWEGAGLAGIQTHGKNQPNDLDRPGTTRWKKPSWTSPERPPIGFVCSGSFNHDTYLRELFGFVFVASCMPEECVPRYKGK